jgi:hypothetical protein
MTDDSAPPITVDSSPATDSGMGALRAILIAIGPLMVAHGISATDWTMYMQVIMGVALVVAPVVQEQLKIRRDKAALVAAALAHPETVVVK